MSITLASLLTQLRTWLLVAGLTALLVAVGAAIGGGFLYLFAALAVVMNAAAYWFSDRIALRASRARPLGEAEAPELHRTVARLAGEAEVPRPRLYLIAAEQPNAFATGRSPRHAAIAVTEGLLAQLTPAEVAGVVAHELAHIRNRDTLVSSIAAMIAGAIAAIANVFQFSLLFGGGEEDAGPLGLIGELVAIIVAPLAAMLLQLGISRQREYLADATAARVLGEGRPLADALERLERGVEAAPLAVNPATAALYIANPLAPRGLARLFATHPPIAERVRRLRAHDAALAAQPA
jgi:heat shock protein HtpX